MKYHAFISYSHADKAWGDWLHRALETYKVPAALVGRATSRADLAAPAGGPPAFETVPGRAYPIFRDREELPTATDLGEILHAALRESRYLIVICSPRSARSQWVNEEILFYKRLGRENRILALIVAGEPNAADGKPGFAVSDECFPEAIKFKLGPDGQLSTTRTEPIAADAREGKDGKPAALLKLLAGVLGVNFDDLRQRDLARQRARLRALLAVSTALTLVFAGLAAAAVWQWRVATERRQVAETRLYQSSIALAYGSLKDAHVGLARQALWRAPATHRNWEWGHLARQVYPGLAAFPLGFTPDRIPPWVSADGRRWAFHADGQLVCARWTDGAAPAIRAIPLPQFAHVDVSADGLRALVCRDGEVALWDCDTATRLAILTGENEPAWDRAFFHDRAGTRWLASHEEESRVRDLATGATLGARTGEETRPELLATTSDGLAIVFSQLEGPGGLIDSAGRWLAPLPPEDAALLGANFAAFSPDEQAAVLMSGDGGVWLLDRRAAAPRWLALRPQGEDLSFRNRLPSQAVFSPDGTVLWFISRQKLHAYDRATATLDELPIPGGFTPACLAVTADQVAVGTDEGHVIFFSTAGQQVVGEGLAHEGPVLRVSPLDAAPARWASLGRDGTLHVWSAPTEIGEARLETLPGFPGLPADAATRRAELASRLGDRLPAVEAAHQTEVPALALNAAGDRLASGGLDGFVRLWSLPDRELLLTLPGPAPLTEELRFSTDPRSLGVLAENYGANAFPRSLVWTAEDWIASPWRSGSAPAAFDPATESSAYEAWRREVFFRSASR